MREVSAFGVTHISKADKSGKKPLTNKEKVAAGATGAAGAGLLYAGGIPGAKGSQEKLDRAFKIATQSGKTNETKPVKHQLKTIFSIPRAAANLVAGGAAGNLGQRANNHRLMTAGWKNDGPYYDEIREKQRKKTGKAPQKPHLFEAGYAKGKIPAEDQVVRQLQRSRNKAQIGLAGLGAGTAAYHIQRKNKNKKDAKVQKRDSSKLGTVKLEGNTRQDKQRRDNRKLSTAAGIGLGGGATFYGIGRGLTSSAKKYRKEQAAHLDAAEKIVPGTRNMSDMEFRAKDAKGSLNPKKDPDNYKKNREWAKKVGGEGGKTHKWMKNSGEFDGPEGEQRLQDFAAERGAAKNKGYFASQYGKYGKMKQKLGIGMAGLGAAAAGGVALSHRHAGKGYQNKK